MPKKDSGKRGEIGGSTLKVLKELFSNLIFSQVITWFKNSVHEIQESIYLTARKILESALSIVIMIVGIIMIVVALPFLLSYYIDMPTSFFSIFIGFILIIVSLISINKINKTKYKKFKEE